MRALHVSKTSDGAFWAVRQVAELVRYGVEVHVALPSTTGNALPAWRDTGATLHFVNCSLRPKNVLTTASMISAVRTLVGEVDPDIIHTHHVLTTMMFRLALGRNHAVPRIFQVPGPLHLEHWHTKGLELAVAGENDYWIAASQFVQQLYRDARTPLTKVFLSYHSTDRRIFSNRRTGYLRKKLNIPHDAIVVGNINLIYPPKRYLGQTVGLKCHEDIIEAISLVQRARNDVWGVLIGGTFGRSLNYEHRLRSLAERKGAGKIRMPGKFNSMEVACSWPDFDCAIHVPLSENCGGVVEPLLSEVPTIAGEVGGLPEVIHEGLTGRLVPAQRPDQLAQAVLMVLENYEEHRQMAQSGRQLASAMFDPERCANEVFSIYRHILFNDPRPEEFSPKRFVNQQITPSRMAVHAGE